MVDIRKTKEYEIFKTLEFNRKTNKKHVQRICNILKTNNLLHLHPIIVSPKMEVIDGQHRLLAAKELGLEIFYFIEDVSMDHVLKSNLIHKNVDLREIIRFYAIKDGDSGYRWAYEKIEEFNISAKAFFSLIFGKLDVNILEFIKEGKFKFPNYSQKISLTIHTYKHIIDICIDKRIKNIQNFKTSNFCCSVRDLTTINHFDIDRFKKNLETQWVELCDTGVLTRIKSFKIIKSIYEA